MKRDNKTNHADLSPVRDAAKQLAALLPDPENPGREAWCFFHFQINDYGAVEIGRASCRERVFTGV